MTACMLSQLSPITPECLSQELHGETCCLVDVRPSAQHCCSHIQGSENINFSNILLRRLIKGVVHLSTHITSHELLEEITQRDPACKKLVLYDSCSVLGSVRMELAKHAEVLYKTDSQDCQVYYLDGGFNAFMEQYPELCERSNSTRKPHSPIGISVSASLPLSFGKTSFKQQLRAQTPLEDESSRFGPPVEVLPFLVLGCARDSSNLTLLRKLGVTAVLNVSHNCASHFESLFEYKIIPVQDSHHADLLSKLDTAFEFINSIKAKGGRVFVHCHAGISRSATVCIAYIMKHMQMNLTKSYDFVKQRRPCVSPNLHFMGQLLEFERMLQDITGGSESPIVSESPVPMEVDCIPVTISTTETSTQPIAKPAIRALRLPLKYTTGKFSRGIKRTLHSASAPSSIDIPEKTTGDIESTDMSTGPVEAEVSTYNYKLMGQFYSSTDGAVYVMAGSSFPSNVHQASSLPTTPLDGDTVNQLLSSCRLQTKCESGLASTNAFDSSAIQCSPCRVVAFNGSNKYV